MYKKVTKIKKVVTQYDTPYAREADDGDMDSVDTVTETKVYDNTVCMDIPFFIKLLEHVNTKVATTAELQIFADKVVNRAKEYPVLTGEWFETLI